MELYCEQEGLATVLKAVLPAVPSRSWSTVEAGMLLRADGHLSVIATDHEMSIRCQVSAQVAKPGEVVLPARTISDLVALLDPDRVELRAQVRHHLFHNLRDPPFVDGQRHGLSSPCRAGAARSNSA